MPKNVPELTAEQIDRFVEDGYVRIDEAFPKNLAAKGRALVWRDIDAKRTNPSTWKDPVVRLWKWNKPFQQAMNTSVLHRAFDQLAGPNRWMRPEGLGIVVRFPSPHDPGDTGWHVDASFPPPQLEGVPLEEIDFEATFADWRVNITSRDRALLMLFLFSDVGEDDAPTRIRAGSHLDIARLLEPAGATGLGGDMDMSVSDGRPEVLATGAAGTVYLCHPFLVHAGQPHRGKTPRILAQPGLPLRKPFVLDRPEGGYVPVETAIRKALGRR